MGNIDNMEPMVVGGVSVGWTRLGLATFILGIFDILVGLTYLIYQAVRIPFGVYAGVWGGLLVLVTGILGVVAGRTRLKGTVIALLVFSIISVVIIVLAVPIAMSFDLANKIVHEEAPNLFSPTTLSPEQEQENILRYAKEYVDMAVVLGVVGLLGFGISLTLSILTCVDLCNCKCC